MPSTREMTTILVTGLVAILLVGGATVGFLDLLLGDGWVRPVAAAIVGGAVLVTAGRLAGIPPVPALVATLAVGSIRILAWHPLFEGIGWRQRPSLVPEGVSMARREIAQQVAPTAFLPGISLIIVAGAFLVAVIVTELLMRRLVLSALLATLVLWVVPLTIPLPERSLGLTAAAFAVPAALALGLIDDRSTPAAGSSWPRRARGLAGAVAIVLVAVPLAAMTPGHDGPPVFDLRGWGAVIDGYEPIVDVGDQLRLPDPRRVLEVTTDSPVNLRTAALDVFDGRTWRVGDSLEQTGIPGSAYEDPTDGIGRGGDDRRIATYDVDVLDLPNVYLPVPNRPVQVATTAGQAQLTYSRIGEFVATDSMDGLEADDGAESPTGDDSDYVASAALPAEGYDDLVALGDVAGTGDPISTALPTPEPALRELAEQLVAEAEATTTIDQVFAIQDHFEDPDTSEFAYSTDVPELRGDDALNDFVFTTRTGYCEYFATAMAVMLRTLDIPTRVATGYLPGFELVPAGPTGGPATYAVSSTDAHAWVEVQFPGVGWLTFDPTPRSDTAGLRPSVDNLAPVGGRPGDGFGPDDLSAFEGLNEFDAPSGEAAEPAGSAVDTPGTQRRGMTAATWILVVLLVLAAGFAILWWRGRTAPSADDPTESALLAVSHLLVGATALGHGRASSETLHEVLHRWCDELGVDVADASTIADLGGRAAFGGALTHDDADRVRAACRRVGRHLHEASDVTDRVLATPRRVRAKP